MFVYFGNVNPKTYGRNLKMCRSGLKPLKLKLGLLKQGFPGHIPLSCQRGSSGEFLSKSDILSILTKVALTLRTLTLRSVLVRLGISQPTQGYVGCQLTLFIVFITIRFLRIKQCHFLLFLDFSIYINNYEIPHYRYFFINVLQKNVSLIQNLIRKVRTQ